MAITKASNSGIKTGVLKYDSMLAGNAAYEPSSVDSIDTVTVGSGGTSTITFSSIPSTYTHLQLRALAKTNRSDATTDILKVTINSNTGSNYAWHALGGHGSSVFTDRGSSTTYIRQDWVAGDGSGSSNVFGAFVLDILDYANTNKYKTYRFLTGVDTNSGSTDSRIYLTSGLWMSTSAMTSISFAPLDGTLFKQYSHFALYGIKAVS